VRRIAVVAAIVPVVIGCGSGAAAHTPIVFGTTGGNIAPYRVSIQPNGSVRVRGSQRRVRRRILPARVRQLRREIQRAHLSSRRCRGVLPDVASRYIGAVTVHGDCERRFTRVWNDLTKAVGA
jgi:hypothetical protein